MYYLIVWILVGLFVANHAHWQQSYRDKRWIKFQILGFLGVTAWPVLIVARSILMLMGTRLHTEVYAHVSKEVTLTIKPSLFVLVAYRGATAITVDAGLVSHGDLLNLKCETLGFYETFTVGETYRVNDSLDLVTLHKDHIF